jgi:hypothetical protein
LSTTNGTTGSAAASNNNPSNNAPVSTNNIVDHYTLSINVKKVPFEGTEASFYLWTTQILGFAESYACEQATLGNIAVPPSSTV